MRLSDYITEDLVFIIHGVKDKTSFLHRLVSCLKKQFPNIDKKKVFTRLQDREKRGPTVFGNGVAIPHAIVEGLERVLCVIARIPEGVDFNVDGEEPVNIVFMILSPPEKSGENLVLLAKIARLVSKGEFISRIANINDAGDVYSEILKQDMKLE